MSLVAGRSSQRGQKSVVIYQTLRMSFKFSWDNAHTGTTLVETLQCTPASCALRNQ